MKRKEIRAVVDYIARNKRCTFPSSWDTGEGIEAEVTFAQPPGHAIPKARKNRDKLVEEIKAALNARESDGE